METNTKQTEAEAAAAVEVPQPPPPPAEALSASDPVQAAAQKHPALAAFLEAVAGGAEPGEAAEKHFGAVHKEACAEEPAEPAMYRSSLEPPGAPRPFPTFLSSISRSVWD